jgi:subtilisin family serine protease
MKQLLPRGLGLALALLLAAITGGALLLAPVQADPPSLLPHSDSPPTGGSFAAEPPPEKTIWDRVSDTTATLLHRDKATLRDAVQRAVTHLGVPAWHLAGYRGKGIKIAVLDSGYRGYRAALGKALPAAIKERSFRRDGLLDARPSQHGILCAEIIHRLAPDAELLLATWEPDEPTSFLQAVRWARAEGANILSCSIIMPTWSDCEGNGPNHRALQAAMGAGDQRGDGLFFASAGNTALRHWYGPVAPAKDGWHQWAAGKKDNHLHPRGKERVSVELCGNGSASFELVVRDLTLQADVGRSHSGHGEADHFAVVHFHPRQGHHYAVRVRQLSVTATAQTRERFHLTVLGGKIQYASKTGSIPFPGDGPEVVAVGAVDEHGSRQVYSSCGPNQSGPKPDLVATVPFPSEWRPEQAFSGTSAAAPQAAGLAALVWARHAEWTANHVRLALRASAFRQVPGHNVEKGFGLLRMPPVGTAR